MADGDARRTRCQWAHRGAMPAATKHDRPQISPAGRLLVLLLFLLPDSAGSEGEADGRVYQ